MFFQEFTFTGVALISERSRKKSKYFAFAKNATISRENVELIYYMTPQIQHPTVLKAPFIFVTKHCHIPAMS